MAFFNKFPKIKYDFNREGVVNNIVDIFLSVDPGSIVVDTAAGQGCLGSKTTTKLRR